ncbi:MAG: glycosyltransferase involved in cell wall biosynthesis [Polaribacter sp.]|jgi:glycosyltransferase involved in cell wall biosynthesis
MNRTAKINKIALLLYGLHGGGAERVMLTLANAWAKQGIQVDFLLGLMEGPYQDMLGKDLNIFVFNKRIKKLLPPVVKYLNKHQPDILLSTLQPVNTMAALAGKISSAKTKIVLREANSPTQKLKVRKGRGVKFYFGHLPRFAYPFAQGYVSVSEGLKKEMTQFYSLPNQKIRTIYNPVVNDDLYRMAQSPVDHPAMKTEEKIILAIGRVVPQKDFATLIKAFAQVKKTNNCRLVILGDRSANSSYYQSMITLAKQLDVQDSIYYIDFQRNPFAFLKRADVFVLSSKFEGLPGALIQALACECQVVSTDCPHGPLEILQNGAYGSLVAMEDHNSMAAAITQRLINPDHSLDFGEITKRFNHTNGVQEYLDYFKTL